MKNFHFFPEKLARGSFELGKAELAKQFAAALRKNSIKRNQYE